MEEKIKRKIAIVIPVHNEEENIGLLLEEILKINEKFLIIVINDNSSDGSREILEDFSSKYEEIKIFHRQKQEGLHAAIIDGIKKASKNGVDGVITMDGDFSHSPAEILSLLENFSIAEIVVGSRFVKNGKTVNWKISKKIISFCARTLSRILLKIKTSDCTSGFKCYSKKFLSSFSFDDIISKGYAFQVETILRAELSGARVVETPIVFYERRRGRSKVDTKEIIRYIKSLIKLLKLREKIKNELKNRSSN